MGEHDQPDQSEQLKPIKQRRKRGSRPALNEEHHDSKQKLIELRRQLNEVLKAVHHDITHPDVQAINDQIDDLLGNTLRVTPLPNRFSNTLNEIRRNELEQLNRQGIHILRSMEQQQGQRRY